LPARRVAGSFSADTPQAAVDRGAEQGSRLARTPSGGGRAEARTPPRDERFADQSLIDKGTLMELNLAGKSVIVTGGGSNIGRAISLAFARERVHLSIAEIDEGQGARTAAEGERQGAASAQVIQADVTKWDSVRAMVKAVEARHGKVDVLVNNVGWTYDRLFIEKTREEWEKEVQINLWGTINCTRAVLDGMIAQKTGAIVSMGSDAGRMGEFREAVYGACKAGIIALSKSLAREVGRHGIRLNVVCPGLTVPASDEEVGRLSMWTQEANRAWTTPDMKARIAKAYPLRRVGAPEDVAPAVVFLASDAARFITGQALSVSGGYTMM
jgi:2-hydroxycyclohexanecarboxyl-CoA dehydrogenase